MYHHHHHHHHHHRYQLLCVCLVYDKHHVFWLEPNPGFNHKKQLEASKRWFDPRALSCTADQKWQYRGSATLLQNGRAIQATFIRCIVKYIVLWYVVPCQSQQQAENPEFLILSLYFPSLTTAQNLLPFPSLTTAQNLLPQAHRIFRRQTWAECFHARRTAALGLPLPWI